MRPLPAPVAKGIRIQLATRCKCELCLNRTLKAQLATSINDSKAWLILHHPVRAVKSK